MHPLAFDAPFLTVSEDVVDLGAGQVAVLTIGSHHPALDLGILRVVVSQGQDVDGIGVEERSIVHVEELFGRVDADLLVKGVVRAGPLLLSLEQPEDKGLLVGG